MKLINVTFREMYTNHGYDMIITYHPSFEYSTILLRLDHIPLELKFYRKVKFKNESNWTKQSRRAKRYLPKKHFFVQWLPLP